nr:hypothetical protein [Tanacetum cinerariifolium]
IDNDIYSTVDACPNACEMWKAIERLKQGESINVQDLETNLFWEFGKFTSLDELNPQHQSHYLLKILYLVSIHNFIIMSNINNNMQTQTSNTLHNAIMEAGSKDRPPMLAPEIRDQLNAEAEAVQIILTGIDNDIYLTVDACPNACEMWKAIKRSQQVATRNRGKAIINSSQLIYDQEPSMVAEDDETSKDKEIDKLMDLISLSFKKIYKPTNNNLQTSSNTSRANQDNSPRINRSVRYENRRIGNVARARETVGSTVVQKSGIQCYNCKEFGHVARECQKLKRAKDAAYHREKMLLCKQEEAGI